MKQQITSSFQEVIKDRYLSVLLGAFLLLALGLLIYLLVTIRPTELQVVVHYTGFGTTNFYRDRWYYLLSFALFIVIMAVVQVVLTYRVLATKGRELAVPFAWLNIILVVIAAALFSQVLRIASLS
jgi:uncharacterized membrane protein